jgi:hypothetical protein
MRNYFGAHLDIASGLSFEPPAQLHPAPVNVKLVPPLLKG